jgi:hypothetical protein
MSFGALEPPGPLFHLRRRAGRLQKHSGGMCLCPRLLLLSTCPWPRSGESGAQGDSAHRDSTHRDSTHRDSTHRNATTGNSGGRGTL